MKRIIALYISILFLVCAVEAVPAFSGKMRVKQGDGSMLTIMLKGDEYAHVTVTVDGYPVAWSENTRSYEYASCINGEWKPNGVIAADPAKRSKSIADSLLEANGKEMATQFLAKMGGQVFRKAHSVSPRIRISDVPTLGKQKALVILVEFSDKKFSMPNPQTFYADLLNKEGYCNEFGATGSARDFYIASSCGAYQPDFEVYGPVQASKSYSYYGKDGGTNNVPELIAEIVKKADSQIDFAQYDTDGDGYVDNVYVFYAGYGQADSHYANTIWPHSYDLEYAGKMVNLDGVNVSRYACSQEINGQTSNPVGIGTFVHEFGHVLGLADHYDTSNKHYSLGYWDTMSAGSYANNQNTPPLFSAFERAELGWLDYTALDADFKGVSSLNPLSRENKAYRINVPDNNNEYFILENRQQEGWDAYLPGHGLLVWHVDMDENAWEHNSINTNANHRRLFIEPADSIASYETEEGDAFPGTEGTSQAWFNTWEQQYVFGLKGVDEVNGIVNFAMAGSVIDLKAPKEALVTDVLGKSAKFSWQAVEDASFYHVELWQANQMLKEWNLGNVASLTLDNLTPETTYRLNITACLAQFRSDEVEVDFTTLPLQYVEKQVKVLSPAHLSENSITALWENLLETESYYVSLYEYQMTGHGNVTCGFEHEAESLPEGWTTSCENYVDNEYGQAPYALKMTKDKDYLLIKGHGEKFEHLKFWLFSYHNNNTFTVEQAMDGKWSTVQVVETQRAVPAYAEMDLSQADSVRIIADVYKYLSLIDDVSLEYICDELHPVENMTDIEVGKQLSYTFVGLRKDQTYSYKVQGRNAAGDLSVMSNPMTIVLDDKTIANAIQNATSTMPAGKTRIEFYDLQGRRVEQEKMVPGIYIVKMGNHVKKVRISD